MTASATTFDTGMNDDEQDVVVVAPEVGDTGIEPNDVVLRAVRYLLYRYELQSGAQALPQMIAVVAASGGEGVTTVSRALAHVLAAETGNSVCWVEVGHDAPGQPVSDQGTAALPAASRRRKRPEIGPGAMDASSIHLVAPDPPSRQRTDATVPGGPQLDQLLHDLAGEYRYIIFDTPPVLSRADSIGFLRRADAYILVTRYGSTTLEQIRTISDELRQKTALGAILNDHRTSTPRFVRRFFRE